MNKSSDIPECFGKLDKVFPLAENGLRQSPQQCMACKYKTQCLRTAVSRDDGLQIKEEKVDRAWQAGRISFFQRWARKKSIAKNKKNLN